MIESITFCDLCGKEIAEEEDEWNLGLHGKPFYDDGGEDMMKNLCDNCRDKVYRKWQEVDWKY